MHRTVRLVSNGKGMSTQAEDLRCRPHLSCTAVSMLLLNTAAEASAFAIFSTTLLPLLAVGCREFEEKNETPSNLLETASRVSALTPHHDRKCLCTSASLLILISAWLEQRGRSTVAIASLSAVSARCTHAFNVAGLLVPNDPASYSCSGADCFEEPLNANSPVSRSASRGSDRHTKITALPVPRKCKQTSCPGGAQFPWIKLPCHSLMCAASGKVSILELL